LPLCICSACRKIPLYKPVFNEGRKLILKGSRHPVIEQQLKIGEPYIANDIYLDNDQQQMIILTGPNMSGKSALLRQTALNVIMAQMGSFRSFIHG
jgi:DNA mismatch repair protein MutS